MTDQLYLVWKEKWVQRKSSTWLYDYMNSCPSSWLVVHLKINHGFWLMNWLVNYVMSILRFPVHKIYIAWLDFFLIQPFSLTCFNILFMSSQSDYYVPTSTFFSQYMQCSTTIDRLAVQPSQCITGILPYTSFFM